MAKLYIADEETIGSLLGNTSQPLKVPAWQRSYSWDTKEISAFWEDIVNFSELHPGKHLEKTEYFLGSVVLVEKPSHFEVLDGQQRLATATIMLAALRDVVRDEEKDAADQIESRYIKQHDIRSQKTRFALQLNNYDKEFFRDTIQNRKTNLPEARLSSHKKIAKAYKYLYDEVKGRFDGAGAGDAGYDEVIRLYSVLTEYVSVVAVKSKDPDNAAAVFETLNDRGIGLSTPDLLRNYLLMRARTASDRNQIVSLWEAILGLTGDGVSVEGFIRHYWVSHYGDVKSRALYRVIKDQIRTSRINSVRFSEQLSDSAMEYATLVNCDAKDKRLETALEGVRALNASVLLPALLSCREVSTEKTQAKLATALVATYVRHTLIGGLADTSLESLVFDIAKELRANKNVSAAIARLRDFAPDDIEFKASFAVAEVARAKSARYLLTAIEHKIRRTGELRVEDSRMTHVEHIYPQSPKKANRLAKHEVLVNRLGNQTLLASALNTSIKNERFSKKVSAYRQSDIKITRPLGKLKKWDEDAIDERQKWLAKYAPKIWVV
jgi:uncharacterized protein with ParB-like and HNH nuclease domain